MRKAVEEICQLIDACSETEQRTILTHLRNLVGLHPLESEWNVPSETILSAISRSSDLTLRGVRGIIAEAMFADVVVPSLADEWDTKAIDRDQSYDFLLRRRSDYLPIRIQVKLQRKEKQAPKLISKNQRTLLTDAPDLLYVVEVQRTRTGRRKSINRTGEVTSGGEEQFQQTRPYRFGEFDIIAVNMHPSTRDWKRFMYTVGAWLIPWPAPHEQLIQTMQPVAAKADNYWTDDLRECIEWLASHKINRLYGARVAQ